MSQNPRLPRVAAALTLLQQRKENSFSRQQSIELCFWSRFWQGQENLAAELAAEGFLPSFGELWEVTQKALHGVMQDCHDQIASVKGGRQ